MSLSMKKWKSDVSTAIIAQISLTGFCVGRLTIPHLEQQAWVEYNDILVIDEGERMTRLLKDCSAAEIEFQDCGNSISQTLAVFIRF